MHAARGESSDLVARPVGDREEEEEKGGLLDPPTQHFVHFEMGFIRDSSIDKLPQPSKIHRHLHFPLRTVSDW
ncbi:uncharacterized protein L3040_006181 [Drepanopeziza brunnea f. sp. 'multigermtubi']|uniref:uncharacterized protein n=1 Tax=Drepanopeziza brunnea f. sp. 'multigermtubi' TaxID=698441 RepID=UPI0023935808|nr:hypothetical protein L3040_006181 [Drepanopeziza brunnea f. sp. 'multigermtubi']